MTRLLTALLLPAVFPLHATVALAGVPGLAARIDDGAMVYLQDGVVLDEFIAAFEKDFPDATLTLAPDGTVPGRPIHRLVLTLTPGTGEALLDVIEEQIETGYPALLRFGELLYEEHAPEGHTGSTYVDGVPVAAFQTQVSRGLLGLDAAHANATGLGAVVAVLDTGVDATHPQLAASVLPDGFNALESNTNTADVAEGTDEDGDGATDEMYGHGTFVAGIVTLVAPDARILPVKVLNSDGVGDGWTLVRGLYFAIDRGVEVINLSLGSTYNSDLVGVAIDDAAAAGIPVFAAAGNLDRNDPEEYPAMREARGVAATDPSDVKADFSNYSDRLFISAPGASTAGSMDPAQAIVSSVPGGGYGTWEGTSFATPFVSAAAALVRSQHFDWSVDVLEDHLAATATDIYLVNPGFAPMAELGAGRLDVASAVGTDPGPSALGDLDVDGDVDFVDLTALLGDWGDVHSPADLDGSGLVGFADLTLLIGNWG